uniref:Uncharacterized protein n=1 Tax=Oryza brachyantha TaxID=4533 RepID=J3N1D6_ORYBR
MSLLLSIAAPHQRATPTSPSKNTKEQVARCENEAGPTCHLKDFEEEYHLTERIAMVCILLWEIRFSMLCLYTLLVTGDLYLLELDKRKFYFIIWSNLAIYSQFTRDQGTQAQFL